MSRNAVAQGAAKESFAGLLEHLTRNSQTETPDPEFETKYTPRSANSASGSIATAGARSGTRALAPMAEARPTLDGVPLSYENALRRHARYRVVPEDFDLSAVDLQKASNGSSETQPQEATSRARTGKNTGNARTAKTGIGPARAQVTAKAIPARGKTTRTQATSVAVPPANPSGPLKTESAFPVRTKRQTAPNRDSTNKAALRSNRSRDESPAELRHGKTRGKSGRAKAASSQVKAQNKPAIGSVSKSKASASARTAVFTQESSECIEAEGATLEPAVQLGKNGLARLDLTMQDRSALSLPTLELSLVDQKRSTVSVRLTDAEFSRLKERAGESGISVSAYMRSCILDADQLRTQVKQALAEMRALTARPEPNLFAALPSPEHSSPANRGDWFRVIVRSAAFLLSPLFPFRRGA